MWKIQDFSVTQILREINFEESRSSKSAVSAILGPSISPKIHKSQNSVPANVLHCQILHFYNAQN